MRCMAGMVIYSCARHVCSVCWFAPGLLLLACIEGDALPLSKMLPGLQLLCWWEPPLPRVVRAMRVPCMDVH